MGKVIKGIDAIGPLADGNVLTKKSTEPTWGLVDSNSLPAPSEIKNIGPLGTGNYNGRNSSVLKQAFNAKSLGLENYDPAVIFEQHMKGEGPLWETNLAIGPGEYGLNSTSHMRFDETPDLREVEIDALNIPNPFVPDVSAGQANAEVYRKDFNEKYSGKQNSYPQGSSEVLHAGTTAEGSDGGLNPTETTQASLGSWMSPTLGKWTIGS